MKRSHLIALVLIAVAVGVIVSMVGSSSSYVTFAEAEAYPGRKFHVVGVYLRDMPAYYNPEEDPNYFSFYMQDGAGEVRQAVIYMPKPRDFEMSEQIVLIGAMREDVFHASDVLMKCPSKYKEEFVKAEP